MLYFIKTIHIHCGGLVSMKVRKQNGREEDFCVNKIINAVTKANNSVEKEKRMDDEKITQVAEFVQKKIKNYSTIDVDTIHDYVEKALMNKNQYEIAKAYVLYRNERKRDKKYSGDELKIISICNSTNEDVSGDNANKRPTFLGTQRDYIAGTKCKSIGRKMLPKEVTKAHDEGSIHFHDMDYSPLMNMSNCCLVNTFDMFTNGFGMGDVGIESAHSFSTACNHLAQIALHVSSSQYGGQTHSWSVTIPFLQKSREVISKRIRERCGEFLTEEQMQKFIDEDLKKEINKGIQTFQYQVITMNSANGQTPFISMNLCLAEAMTEQERKDLAMIIEEVLRQRTQGIKDRNGRIISPLFPKLLYWICDGLNAEETDPYYYLNKLAVDCVVKRMQPDILSEKKCREAKEGQIIPCMGCRSFLTPYWQKKTYVEKDGKIQHAELYSILNYGINWEILDKPNKNYICRSLEPKSIKELYETVSLNMENAYNQTCFDFEDWKIVYNYLGNTARIQSLEFNPITNEYSIEVLEPKTYGRWNQGVVTINTPYVALKSKQNDEDFYKTFDEYLEICHKGLQERHKSIKRIRAENAPILWMDGGLARLNPQDNLDSMLEDNVDYTTISLGYVGLYETCMCLIGKSNTTKEGIKLSKEIMQYMNDKCVEWKVDDKIPYSIYGTPEESTTEKFAKALKKLADGEIIEGVTDHDYITNSYHVCPSEKNIDAFKKLKLEGEYLALSRGGAVSYVECSNNLITNKKAILQLFHYMYENILYSELNFSNQGYCYDCKFEGKLDIIDMNGKLLFQCPHCLNKNQKKLSYVARLCGYIGEFANSISETSTNATQGRIADLRARVYNI